MRFDYVGMGNDHGQSFMFELGEEDEVTSSQPHVKVAKKGK